MSRARAAYSAPSAQRPAQNSTQARPQSARAAPRLVALAPLFVLALEQGASVLPLRERREGVHDRQRRLPHELLAADSAREVAGARG